MQGLRWEIRRQGVPYGGRGDVAFQPGGDARGEVGGVAAGEEESGVLAAEAGEEVRCLLEEGGGRVCRTRNRGEGFAAGLPRPLPRGRARDVRTAVSRLYGTIRAQALTPGESLAFIEQVLGET
ncbi:hypothetical protein SUDANB1_03223 [Streptomyces sp. enrichment culture]